MLFRLPNGRTADDVRIALTRTVAKLPAEMRRNSPWQRGSNENTNGLLRQYFPSKTDLSLHSAAHLNAVARQLNGRPRETLGWMKPVEVFGQSVASIG
jgi:IS30 family transposase